MKLKNYLLFSFTIFFLDRLTKFWALQACAEKIIINQFLSCHIAFNRGISWSLLTTDSVYGFALVTLLVMSVIAIIGWHTYQQFQAQKPIYAEIAIIAAAISNVIDRFWYGGVVDFILLEYHDYSWPLFNFADCVIVGGIFYMLWSSIYGEQSS